MTGSVTIAENALPTAFGVGSTASTYCQSSTGSDVYLLSSEPGVNYQLQKGGMNDGSALAGTGTQLTWTGKLAGTYTVIATNATTNCVNNMTGNVTLIENSLPSPFTFNSGASSYCQGSGGASITLLNSETGVNYQLVKDGLNDGSILQGNGSPLTWQGKLVGTYTVVATNATTNCSNNMTGSIVLTEDPLPTANAGSDQEICLNKSATLAALSGQGIYKWNTNENTSTIKVSPATTTTYTLTVTSLKGCTDTDESVVTVNPLPSADFSATPLEVNTGNAVNFTSSNTTNVSSWKWEFGDKESSNDITSTSHIYKDAGIYNVTLTVTSSKDCEKVYSKPNYITVIEPTKIWVPTAFSPNGDGSNDVLFILGEFKSMHLDIYNQWGIHVFTSDNQSMGWDGTFKGKEQPEGNYTYIINAYNFSDKKIIEQGSITLIR